MLSGRFKKYNGGTVNIAAASQLPILDAGGYYTATDAEGMGQEVGAQLAQNAQYDQTPLASVTVSTNKSVTVSAVNVDTDTFTSVAHGLVNGENVYPVLNDNAGTVYLIDKLPGGITAPATWQKYFVVNATADTFQLSLTSGGAAINLTTNANMDLTKWHFEVPSIGLTISSLPTLSKALVRIRGKSLASNQAKYVVPTSTSLITQQFVVSGVAAYDYPVIGYFGDVWIDLDVVIDFTQKLTIMARGNRAYSASASSNTVAAINVACIQTNGTPGTFTAVLLQSAFLANGTKVEVFRI